MRDRTPKMLTFPDWAHRSWYILKLTLRLRLSVEQDTLPGKLEQVNRFYVSLLVHGTVRGKQVFLFPAPNLTFSFWSRGSLPVTPMGCGRLMEFQLPLVSLLYPNGTEMLIAWRRSLVFFGGFADDSVIGD